MDQVPMQETGPLTQPLFTPPPHLAADCGAKGGGIRGVTGEVVDADAKGLVRRPAEDPFQSLGAGLDSLELALLGRRASIGAVPIPVIHLLAARGPGDAPVGQLVQGTGKITVGKDDPVMAVAGIRRKIDRLFPAAHQARPMALAHPLVEQLNQACDALFLDRKSTRLNSSHVAISYAVFCLKKKSATNKHSQ